MKSIISSAVLGAAVLGQAVAGASIHGHGHVHRRAAASVAAPVVAKRAVNFMSTEDVTSIESKGIKCGKNIPNSEGGPVTVGGDGPFLVEFENKSDEDIVVVCWSGAGQWGAVAATFIGATQPDVTHTLKSNTTTTVSYDPSKAEGNAISGGCGAIHGDTGLTSFSGQLDNTWKEFTYTTDSQFSTTDVSRLVNMAGNKMEIHNYQYKDDAEPACSSTMERCSFQCADGANNCIAGVMPNCPVTAGTTSNPSGADGGCGGLSATGGYVKVNFF